MTIEKTAFKTKPTGKKAVAPDIKEILLTVFQDPQEIHGAVRLKEYESYLRRNSSVGDELEDWLTV
jgi:hypothetical protein